jgi:short-subunit dehydrogenase
VVITGASAGVGRATARKFAERGARIGLIARGDEGLRAAERDVNERGGVAVTVVADVADAEAVEHAAAVIEERLGPIDTWINNAMTSVFAPVKEMTADEYSRVTAVTYLGYVHGTLAALHRMLPRDHGTIVQVGSALAYRGIPLQSAYCAAKHAVQGFTESLRCELYHDHSNVWVTMVQMPALNTPQFLWVRNRLPKRPQPVPPIYQPEVAAQAVLWAAHHRRRELNVGLSTVLAVVGNNFIPGILDHYLGRVGYRSQQLDEPAPAHGPDNLWSPMDAGRHDFGAHGPFDSRARRSSAELWAATHPRLTSAAALGAAGMGCAVWRRLRRRRIAA